MQFFKRILKAPEPEVKGIAREERRSAQRLVINPEFPLKTTLSFTDGDDTRQRRDWKGRLINCSAVGARIQLGPAALAVRGDYCDLKLSLEGFKLVLPCHITNIRVERDGIHFGLKHDIDNAVTQNAYRQLLEIVALGATLKPKFKNPKPDESGFLVEQYASNWQSRLTVWRDKSDKEMTAFEFLLKDCLVRAAREQGLQYLNGTDAATARPATEVKAAEIHRLFRWVTANLPASVPADVREFLQYFVT